MTKRTEYLSDVTRARHAQNAKEEFEGRSRVVVPMGRALRMIPPYYQGGAAEWRANNLIPATGEQ